MSVTHMIRRCISVIGSQPLYDGGARGRKGSRYGVDFRAWGGLAYA